MAHPVRPKFLIEYHQVLSRLLASITADDKFTAEEKRTIAGAVSTILTLIQSKMQ